MSFISFASIFAIDIFLGACLGLLVNKIVGLLNLNNLYLRMAAQLVLSILVVYLLKQYVPSFHKGWDSENGYGIIFLTFFFAFQSNISGFRDSLNNLIS